MVHTRINQLVPGPGTETHLAASSSRIPPAADAADFPGPLFLTRQPRQLPSYWGGQSWGGKQNQPAPPVRPHGRAGEDRLSWVVGLTSLLRVRGSVLVSHGFPRAASVWGFLSMQVVDPHARRCNACSWNSYPDTKGPYICSVLCRTALFCFLKIRFRNKTWKLSVDLKKTASVMGGDWGAFLPLPSMGWCAWSTQSLLPIPPGGEHVTFTLCPYLSQQVQVGRHRKTQHPRSSSVKNQVLAVHFFKTGPCISGSECHVRTRGVFEPSASPFGFCDALSPFLAIWLWAQRLGRKSR